MANYEYPCMANRSDPVSICGMTAAVNWEIAKGYLRAVVAAQGSMSTSEPSAETKFRKLEIMVDAFVQEVECNGLND